ncbi:MAG: S1/P1 nuclease [Ferruginibacter sp.]|nr:S1/P1 nuclease [Ferruginibacter sp.]
MQKFKNNTLICLCICLPFVSNAWGVLGHRIVGQIADSYLTPKAKIEITKILGFESVAMASNWPDFIKSDPAYKYLSTWHYVNLKAGLVLDTFTKTLVDDIEIDAYTKTNFVINELKVNKLLTTETKQLYLRVLIHLIGDVHQPLHLGRLEDRGGNSIKVKWFGDESNLHQVWDEKLINFQQMSYTEYANYLNHTTLQQRKTWQKQTLVQWLFDTYQLTEKVYAETVPDSRLDFLYNFKFVAPMNDQLLKGGVHLAGVLNEVFI